MARWKFRSCPRCDGDMIVDRDQYGWYEDCIQCGYMGDLVDIVELEQQQACGENEERGKVKTSSRGK